jgi:molecular chaperone HscB
VNLSDDDFTLFGLPQRFELDRAGLDQRWRALQSEVHPDRFAADGAAAQRLAMQWAVRVNEAYRRLKDPLARGAYLCTLRGQPVRTEDNTAMPPEFLVQQMAWREALDEAAGLAAVEALDAEVRADEQRRLAALAAAFDRDGDTEAAARQVRALMFVARFRRDLAQRLEAYEDQN